MTTNDAQGIATTLYGFCGLVSLWYLVFFCLRDYKTDKLRQEIFNLRAQLFEFAASGGISFQSRSYLVLRVLLNSMIRFAHETSFVRLVAAIIYEKIRPTPKLPKPLELMRLDELDPGQRDFLKKIHNRLMIHVGMHILTTSIFAFPSLIAYVVYTVTRHGLFTNIVRVSSEVSVREIVLDERLGAHMQLIEQQAVDTREEKLREVAAATC